MTDKTQLFELLYKSCLEHSGLLEGTLMNYIDTLSEQELAELEDFLVIDTSEWSDKLDTSESHY